jgi:WD40 repeat protein
MMESARLPYGRPRLHPRSAYLIAFALAIGGIGAFAAPTRATPGETSLRARPGPGPDELILELPPTFAAPGPVAPARIPVSVWVDPEFSVEAIDVLACEPELHQGAIKPRVVLTGEQWLRGRKLVTMLVTPVEKDPVTGATVRTTRLHLKLRGARTHAERAPALRPRSVPWEGKVEDAIVKGPWCDLRQAPAPPLGDPLPSGPWPPSPTFRPTTDGSPVEYVIVTNATLAPEFQRLADWKTEKGVQAVVRTMEWINATYPQGVDSAEKLRFFLADAYAHWGTLWVLLGGDSEVVPPRYAAHALMNPPELIPSDLYYGCLDGNWNADGDALFGEGQPPGETTGGDRVDLVPELMVGRATVSTPAQAAVFIDKVIAYEQAVTRDSRYPGSILLLGERLSPTLDGAAFCEAVAARLPAAMRKVRMYENHAAYPGALPETRLTVIDSMRAGFGIVHHVGHGFRNTMSVGEGALSNADVDALANVGRISVLYAVNCSSTAFDYNSIGERFLKNPNGGGVAYIGSSRISFTGESDDFQNAFYDLAFGSGVVSIGQALAFSKLGFLADAVSETPARWFQFSLLLLGDPEMPLWRQSPNTLQVAHASTIPLGGPPFAVTVTAGGNPVAGARVAIRKAGDAFAVGQTGSNGVASLDLRPSTTGALTITATRLDQVPRRTTASVVPSAVPVLELIATAVDDDATSPSMGNGDGKADAGETVALRLTLKNVGGGTASGISAFLRAPTGGEFVRIATGAVSYGALGAQGQSNGSGPFVIELDPAAPAAFAPPLELTVTSGALRFVERFVLPVQVVRLDPEALVVSDPAPLGNGNGIPEAGEQIAIQLSAQNLGTGRAEHVQAILEVIDRTTLHPHPLVQVTDPVASFPPILPGETEAGDPVVFRLGSGVNASAILLALTWSDSHGVRARVRADLLPPPSAGGVAGTGSEHAITLQWTPVLTADLRGYDVYRAPTPTGPFARVNGVVVAGAATYEDQDLAPLTRYAYRIVSRDSSGNVSPPSATVTLTTTPGFATGWPIETRQETSAGVLAEDLDRDGDLELVTGADAIYAWHHEGTELRDGDQNPLTSGIFTLDGINASIGFHATPAAADLTGDGDREIVATAWKDAKVYVWNVNGTRESGWPKSIGGDFNWASPAIEDLDLDGSYEIVAVSGHDGKIWAWHANGQEVIDGDHNPATSGVLYPTGTYFLYASPAVGDLDGDFFPEVVVGTQSSDGRVFAVKRTGQLVPGWPRATGGQVTASPALADLDGDGRMEVVIASESDSVFVWRGDGTRYPGWPKPAIVNSTYGHTSSPVVADLDGNGQLDILFAANDGRFHVWNRNGVPFAAFSGVTFAPGTATQDYTQATPTVADLDSDGFLEVVLGAEDGKIYGWNHDGTDLAGFPITTGGEIRGAVTIQDLDADGRLELAVAGNDRVVSVWDLPGELRGNRMPWPTFRHDSRNTGRYGADLLAVGVSDPGTWPAGAPPLKLAFLGAAPNPFYGLTRLRIAVPGGEGTGPFRVRLRIVDVAGRVVADLWDGPLVQGPHEVPWDGRTGRGGEAPSGTYFVRLERGTEIEGGRIVRVR